jgi:hypothetical protein
MNTEPSIALQPTGSCYLPDKSFMLREMADRTGEAPLIGSDKSLKVGHALLRNAIDSVGSISIVPGHSDPVSGAQLHLRSGFHFQYRRADIARVSP